MKKRKKNTLSEKKKKVGIDFATEYLKMWTTEKWNTNLFSDETNNIFRWDSADGKVYLMTWGVTKI